MKNILTVDLEDWYQGIEISCSKWGDYGGRIEVGLERLLSIMAKKKVKATFFVLGYLAEKYPHLIEWVRKEGHEIATHGYSHTLVYKQDPEEFSEELERSLRILEEIVGGKIRGHRAAYFSITKDSLWAIDILSKQGIEYDSSIFPIRNYRYGILGAPRFPYLLQGEDGRTLQEIPLSTVKLFGRIFPISGGAYLRIFPYRLLRWGIEDLNKKGIPAVIYIHPWELDPDHPRIDLPLRIKFSHYYNLKSTEGKLRALLDDFQFVPVKEWLKEKVKGKDKVIPLKKLQK